MESIECRVDRCEDIWPDDAKTASQTVYEVVLELKYHTIQIQLCPKNVLIR